VMLSGGALTLIVILWGVFGLKVRKRNRHKSIMLIL